MKNRCVREGHRGSCSFGFSSTPVGGGKPWPDRNCRFGTSSTRSRAGDGATICPQHSKPLKGYVDRFEQLCLVGDFCHLCESAEFVAIEDDAERVFVSSPEFPRPPELGSRRISVFSRYRSVGPPTQFYSLGAAIK